MTSFFSNSIAPSLSNVRIKPVGSNFSKVSYKTPKGVFIYTATIDQSITAGSITIDIYNNGVAIPGFQMVLDSTTGVKKISIELPTEISNSVEVVINTDAALSPSSLQLHVQTWEYFVPSEDDKWVNLYNTGGGGT